MKKLIVLFLLCPLLKTNGQKQLYFNTGSGQWDAVNYWADGSAAGPFNISWINASDAYFTSPVNGYISFPAGVYRPVIRHIFSTPSLFSILGNPTRQYS